MPFLRPARLIAVIVAVAAVLLPGTAYGLAPQDKDPLAHLRHQADQTITGLKKATKSYKRHRKDLHEAKKRLAGTQSDLRKASRRLATARVPVARLANAQYQDPVTGVSGLMTANGTQRRMRAVTDAVELTRRRTQTISQVARLYDSKKRLAGSAQRQVTSVKKDKKRLSREIKKLRKQADRNVRTLLRKAAHLGMAPDRTGRYGMYGCDAKAGPQAEQYPNGLIPERYLCSLPQKGYQLRADAAMAFYRLNVAYKQRFGTAACVTSAYRGLAKQKALYQTKPPGYAAVPGTSNHGRGLAVDLCGGVQSQGSAQFTWLRTHAGKYGWKHPAWAYTGPFEPWHWEYVPHGGHPSTNGDPGAGAGN